jgi:hypothetical protein
VAWLYGGALAAAALLSSASALAANITVTNPTTTRDEDGGTTLVRTDVARYYISFKDCIDNIELDFPVSAASHAGFQVWASATTDCKTALNRTTAGSGCVELVTSFPTGTGKVAIKARDLVKQIFNIDGSCIDTSTTTSPRPLNIYFMLSPDNGDVDASNVYVWANTQVDLLGPAAPTGLSLGVGDHELKLSLPTNQDSDTLGYYIFCDDGTLGGSSSSSTTSSSSGTGGTGGTTGTGGSGTSGAGGTGGASSSSSTTSSASSATSATSSASSASSSSSGAAGATACETTETIGGIDPAHPDITSPAVCGIQIPASATEPAITVLGDGSTPKNGTRYRVGVAAYDEVNNIGPISILQCGTPAPTDTFFGQYCADGGVACTGGCSSCALGSDRDYTWHGLGAAALAAVMLGLRRDARRRRNQRQKAVEIE